MGGARRRPRAEGMFCYLCMTDDASICGDNDNDSPCKVASQSWLPFHGEKDPIAEGKLSHDIALRRRIDSADALAGEVTDVSYDIDEVAEALQSSEEVRLAHGTRNTDDFVVTVKASQAVRNFKIGVCAVSADVLVVMEVYPGPVGDWNAAHLQKQVKRHDRIVAIDDVDLPASDLMQELDTNAAACLAAGEAVHMRIRRPSIWKFELAATGGDKLRLGVKLAELRGHSLIVETVSRDGALAEHNARNPSQRIVKGDCVIEVNGIKDNVQKMLACLRQGLGHYVIVFVHHN